MLSLVSLLGVAALASPASAQGTALDRFQPAPAGDRMFGVQAPSSHGHLDWHLGLIADYGHNPLVLTHARGVGDVGAIVEHQMLLHVNAAFVLWDRLTISADMPFAVVQDGSDGAYFGSTVQGADGPALGDLRFGLRSGIFGERDDVVSLGAGGYLWLPTGGDWAGQGSVRASLELLLGGRGGPVYWSVGFGPQFREAHQVLDIAQGTSLAWSGGIGVLLGDDEQVSLGPETRVSITLDDLERRNTNAEILLGAKYRFADHFELGAAAGPGIAEGVGTPDFRGVLSFGFTTDVKAAAPPADTDGDGVHDHIDACKDVVGPASDDPAKHGCPPASDGDSDGIADGADACPDVAGVASDVPTLHGCPPDSDGDGVRDDLDACPDVAPAPGASDPDKPGCPIADKDGDGVPDATDACADLAGVSSPNAADNGCPPDSDGDGFRDDQDGCPKVKGLGDADPAKRGCPKAVRLVGNEIQILQQVQFATGTSVIKTESNELLDEVAQVLVDQTAIELVEVAGHTDDRGGANLNRRLSQQRAESVMKALVARGVSAERLSAKGYGPDQPLVANDSDDNRAKNRRVQFRIEKRKSP